jgi:hypothetical protein
MAIFIVSPTHRVAYGCVGKLLLYAADSAMRGMA